MKPLYLILIGPQGAGKGTQAEYLQDHFSIPAISVGSMFRAEIKKGSELGKRLGAVMASGKLAPDELTNQVVATRLKAKDIAGGIILDGYPRTSAQAQGLAELVEINAAIIIKIKDKEAVRRLTKRLVCEKCGLNYNLESRPPAAKGICDKDGGKLIRRKDDTPKAIRERLKSYHTETEPLVDYYRRAGLAVRVNGEQPIVEVHEEIVTELKRLRGIQKVKVWRK